jgi:hypothetical protein
VAKKKKVNRPKRGGNSVNLCQIGTADATLWLTSLKTINLKEPVQQSKALVRGLSENNSKPLTRVCPHSQLLPRGRDLSQTQERLISPSKDRLTRRLTGRAMQRAAS